MKMYKGNASAEVEHVQKSIMERHGWSIKKGNPVEVKKPAPAPAAKPKPQPKATSTTATAAKTTDVKTKPSTGD